MYPGSQCDILRGLDGLCFAARCWMASTIWKGHITFGLVNVPVRLQKAARKERIPLRYVSKAPKTEAPRSAPDAQAEEEEPESLEEPDETSATKPVATPGRMEGSEPPIEISRIRQSVATAEGGEPVRPHDLLRGYEIEPEKFVTFRKEELRQLRPATSATMEIVRSVRLAEIDPVFFETSYYVAPDSAGERAYALLVEALRQSGYVALATMAMHGREHVVILRSGQKGLIAHTMYYVNEVRRENEYPTDVSQINPKELQLAKTLLAAIAGDFAPEEFKDRYLEGVRDLIETKANRKEVAMAGQTTSAEAPESVPVIDIMDALKKSLELKKPAASEQKSARHGKRSEPKSGARKRTG
jgi:DNA end-binding protein Ku